jgi:putative addiction module component (TIGR02574 family)
MNDLRELFKLSIAERIQLVEDLWDSIAADSQNPPPLTEAQCQELDRRVAAYQKDPSATLDAETVHKQLWSRVK